MREFHSEQSNICTRCNGKGEIECSSCHGRGGRHARRYRPTDFSYRSFKSGFEWESCPNCDGSGQQTCPRCHGDSGSFAQSDELVVSKGLSVQDMIKQIIEMLRSPLQYDIPNTKKAERWACRLEELRLGFYDEVKVIEDLRFEVESDFNDFYGAYPKAERHYLVLLSSMLATLRDNYKQQTRN